MIPLVSVWLVWPSSCGTIVIVNLPEWAPWTLPENVPTMPHFGHPGGWWAHPVAKCLEKTCWPHMGRSKISKCINCTVIHNATQLHAYKIRGNPLCLPVFTRPLLLAISFLEIHLACQLRIGFSAAWKMFLARKSTHKTASPSVILLNFVPALQLLARSYDSADLI
jgi:hypothetical protein